MIGENFYYKILPGGYAIISRVITSRGTELYAAVKKEERKKKKRLNLRLDRVFQRTMLITIVRGKSTIKPFERAAWSALVSKGDERGVISKRTIALLIRRRRIIWIDHSCWSGQENV